MTWPAVVLLLSLGGLGALCVRTVIRAANRADADEAQRELLALLAEQAADRTIADNLDV
jgi:hypothetical protein